MLCDLFCPYQDSIVYGCMLTKVKLVVVVGFLQVNIVVVSALLMEVVVLRQFPCTPSMPETPQFNWRILVAYCLL